MRGKSLKNICKHLSMIILAVPSKHALMNSNLRGVAGLEKTFITSGLSSNIYFIEKISLFNC